MAPECPICEMPMIPKPPDQSVRWVCLKCRAEALTPGSPKPKADDSRNPYRPSSGSDASLTGQGAFASMLEWRRHQKIDSE